MIAPMDEFALAGSCRGGLEEDFGGRDVIFCLTLVGAFVLLKIPLLDLPVYHDESYVVTAAWAIRQARFWPFPAGAESYGHPPVGFELAALAWFIFPPRPWALHVLSVSLAAVTLVATYRIGAVLWTRVVGSIAAVLLAVCPLFFAQAGLLQLDLVATAFATTAFYALVRQKFALYVTSGCLMLLSKETSVILLLPLFAYAWIQTRDCPKGARMRALMLCATPLVAFCLWVGVHKAVTGFWWGDAVTIAGNKDIVLNNLKTGLSKRFAIRWIQLLNADQSDLVPASLLIGAWALWLRVRGRAFTLKTAVWSSRGSLDAWYMVLAIVTYLGFHAVFGVLHPRYLLPVFPPLFLLVAAALHHALGRRALYALALMVPASVFGWYRAPFTFSAPEANLDYVDAVRVQEALSSYLEQYHDREVILASAFPTGGILQTPLFGYVKHPLRVLPIESPLGPSTIRSLRFDWACLSSSDQFQTDVASIISARRLREVKRFRSGRHFVVLYR
jgi:4-amino-4-deoxy-L-arabinose transferase-like glycosyltransferase